MNTNNVYGIQEITLDILIQEITLDKLKFYNVLQTFESKINYYKN